MQLRRLGPAAVALVALAAVAAVVYTALLTALDAVGVPRSAASPAALGAVVSVALAAADVYTPLGNNQRTEQLREKPADALGVDFAVTSTVGFVVGGGAGVLLLSPDAAELRRMTVVAAAVLVGYGTFVARNLAVYSPRAVADDDTAEI